jgi:hypothetical protein
VISDSTRTSSARLGVALERYDTGFIVAQLVPRLPGTTAETITLRGDVSNADEMFSLAGDFHQEWKAWGSLLDCVLDDWAHHQLPLPL